MIFAPGADDDASGVSAVLELARVLKDIPLNKTVLFVAFTAEEQWMVGSYFFANTLYNQGTDVEFMLNLDMIGYTADTIPDVALHRGYVSTAYAEVFYQSALRVTSLQPYIAASQASDGLPFDEYGYQTAYVEEGDFNTPGWHHNIDVTTRMNFPYMAQELRMIVAALGQVDLAAKQTDVDAIYDGGDGQSLRVAWNTDCLPEYTYRILYGIQSGNYTDTVDVPSGVCYYDLGGLTLGQKYYISLVGTNPEGHGPIYITEGSGTPYLYPKAPANFKASPDFGQVFLTWKANKELDLSHYCLFRRAEDATWAVLQDNIIDTSFADATASPHFYYEYRARAVDNSGYYSDSSGISGAVPASFDGGMLFVEETSSGGMDPTEGQQAAYYDGVFSGETYTKYYLDSSLAALSRSTAGQYGSIIWIDDDVSTHLFLTSEDSVRWYLGYDSTDILLAGNETVYWLTSSNPLYPGHFVYDNFGITRVFENQNLDFTGATGLGGWPTLHVNPSGIFGPALPCVSIFETLPGAEVIYTYNSSSGNPTYQGKPAGVIYQAHGGKRIALSFPLYYLNESEAQALIAKVFDYFDEVVVSRPYGDVNDDGHVNALDVTFLINYLYKNGTHPSDPDYADPNGSCTINALDVTFLINYLYKGGRTPVAGCVP